MNGSDYAKRQVMGVVKIGCTGNLNTTVAASVDFTLCREQGLEDPHDTETS
jgi:hypothetical protein